MEHLYKNKDGEIRKLILIGGGDPSGFLPEGGQLVESSDENKLKAKVVKKMAQIRSKRDELLSENDKEWIIAGKQKKATKDIEDRAQELRDLPAMAQVDLDAMATEEEVEAYDPFAEE